MTKTKIFDDIVSIMKCDASCCKDEHGANPEIYRSRIWDDMDDEEFLFVVKSYLASFHVMGHVNFGKENRGGLLFSVQRYKDVLYVCDVAANSPFSIGDRIMAIDGHTIKEYATIHGDMMYGESEERQAIAWEQLLGFAKQVTIEKAETGEVKTYPIVLGGTWDSKDRYICKLLRDNVAYLQFADFADEVAIQQLYTDNAALLRNSDYLIIDVRGNGGGTDTAFLPLLKFCLPEGKQLADMKDGIFDSGIEINYSERTCDSRLQMFEEYKKMDIPDETRLIIQQMMDELIENRGKGFVEETSEDYDFPDIGLEIPKKIFIITDQRCRSSGDAFVDIMRKSEKVTVVGRPTLGIMDFSNCAEVTYDDYYFIYPTSRALYLDKNIQMRNHGVPVDIYIPWTPEHLDRDVDLDKVMELIGQLNQSA